MSKKNLSLDSRDLLHSWDAVSVYGAMQLQVKEDKCFFYKTLAKGSEDLARYASLYCRLTGNDWLKDRSELASRLHPNEEHRLCAEFRLDGIDAEDWKISLWQGGECIASDRLGNPDFGNVLLDRVLYQKRESSGRGSCFHLYQYAWATDEKGKEYVGQVVGYDPAADTIMLETGSGKKISFLQDNVFLDEESCNSARLEILEDLYRDLEEEVFSE